MLGQNKARGAQAEAIKNIIFHRAYVSIYDDLAAVFQSQRSRLDFVFANARVFEGYPFNEKQDVSPEGPRKLDMGPLDVNLGGVVMTSYLVLHYFRSSPHGGFQSNLIINSRSYGLYPTGSSPQATFSI